MEPTFSEFLQPIVKIDSHTHKYKVNQSSVIDHPNKTSLFNCQMSNFTRHGNGGKVCCICRAVYKGTNYCGHIWQSPPHFNCGHIWSPPHFNSSNEVRIVNSTIILLARSKKSQNLQSANFHLGGLKK